MAGQKYFSQNELSKEDTVRLIIDYVHRMVYHHVLWYTEVVHQFGREKALKVLSSVYARSYDIQINRLAKVLDFKLERGLPVPLLKMDISLLNELKEKIAVNWLANDGVWFQALEFSSGLYDAKLCNDSCWAQFSPFEAWSIKRFLGLSDSSGLEGLKRALNFRLYASINKQTIIEESEGSFIFQMNDCRVQSARKRKGLADYPCKSGGMIEYSSFAETIDLRIKTECIACPPDEHPQEWYCAWRFFI